MSTLNELLQQFSVRYHKPLVARAALLAGLGSGCCLLLAWRLTALKFGLGESFGIAGGLVVVWFALLALWLRSRWLPPRETAAYLDDALGLKQRLVTAEEFAKTPGRSPLYTHLVNDLSGRVSTAPLKTPRCVNHTTGLLAVALLLLLLWPQLNPVLPPLLRLPEKQPPQPKEQPSAQNPQEPPQQQQPQSSAQQKSAGGQSQSPSGQQQSGQGQSSTSKEGQSSTSGTNQNQPGQSGQNNSGNSAQPSNNSSNSSGSVQSQSGAASTQQNQPGGRQNAQPGARTSGQSAGATEEEAKASAGSQQTPSSAAEKSAAKAGAAQGQNSPASVTSPQQAAQASSTANSRTAGQQQSAKASAQPSGRPGPQSNYESPRAQQSMQGQKQESPAAREGSGNQGLGQSPGNAAELKADIQQLLKEMSGELKDLQQQWEAQNQDRPQAGSGTDPNLYGDAEKLDSLSSRSPSPLEIEADEKPTSKSGRHAGGTGKASGNVSDETPQAKPEQAQLADQPTEEGAVSRQPVPAEYRSVFDQLRRHDTQPSGGQKP